MIVGMKKPAQRPAPTWHDTLVALRWPLTLVVLVAIVAGVAYMLVRGTLDLGEQTIRAGADTVDRVADRAERIAKRFRTGTITETFRSSLPTIDRNRSGLLEVGTLEMVETFERSDERRVFWDAIPLGTTVSEIQVPVTYRYHVRLDGAWSLTVDEHTCRVVAPAIQPTLPPAIHTEGLEKRSEESWLRFDGDDQLAELEKGITPRLRQMAGDPRHVAAVRDAARTTVAEFVRSWLLMEDHWGGDRFRMIQVTFEDEAPEEARQLPMTLTLDDS